MDNNPFDQGTHGMGGDGPTGGWGSLSRGQKVVVGVFIMLVIVVISIMVIAHADKPRSETPQSSLSMLVDQSPAARTLGAV